MKLYSLIIFFLILNPIFPMQNSETPEKLNNTKWEIHPSFKYDVLCFLNIMTGDEFYLNYYRDEYDKFKDKLTPEVSNSLSNLKRIVKDENGNVLSAWLCLYFSAVNDETLSDLILTANDLSLLNSNFEKSPYHSDKSRKMFESIIPDLKIVFKWLEKIEFENYWRENIKSIVDDSLSVISKDLYKYDVIEITEQHLGHKLSSDTIVVYLLFYSQPHGIKITGTRFLTDVAWPFEILMRTASHEMMHPPFDLKKDTILLEKINLLKNEKFFMDKVLNHNPSFGYNSLEGFVEEDCVQALDQIINEKLGIAKDPKVRWKDSDDGMHVLAIALYKIMKDESYNSKNYVFRDFFIENIDNGKLLNGNIEKVYNEFYSE